MNHPRLSTPPLHRIPEEAANCYVWYKRGGNFEEKRLQQKPLANKELSDFFWAAKPHTQTRGSSVLLSLEQSWLFILSNRFQTDD